MSSDIEKSVAKVVTFALASYFLSGIKGNGEIRSLRNRTKYQLRQELRSKGLDMNTITHRTTKIEFVRFARNTA